MFKPMGDPQPTVFEVCSAQVDVQVEDNLHAFLQCLSDGHDNVSPC
jgi:hypothetical protein